VTRLRRSIFAVLLGGIAAALVVGAVVASRDARAAGVPLTHSRAAAIGCAAGVSGNPVRDITYRILHDTAGPSKYPGFWGYLDWAGHSQVWRIDSSTYCWRILQTGTFTTVSATSPNHTGTVSDGLTGTYTGDIERIIHGAYTPGGWTSGDAGAFDDRCVITADRTRAQCDYSAAASLLPCCFANQSWDPFTLVASYHAANGTSMVVTSAPPSYEPDVQGDITGTAQPPPPAPARLVGWAPGGKTSDPRDQERADAAHIRDPGECADNSILLFRVRGSSEIPGSATKDRLGAWAGAAGNELIHRGWEVRDMQADYPAPGLPLWQVGAGLTGNPVAVAIALKALKDYRDVATRSWPAVKDMIVNAYNRCPQRTILLAGYSLGGIVLRYVVPRLPASVRARIARIDLVADPTEQGAIDAAMVHNGAFSSRSTPEGIDTFAAKRLNPFFQQAHYPADVAPRTIQYCIGYDVVCEASVVNFAPSSWAGESKRHTSYNWAGIGVAAAQYADSHKSWR